MRNEYKIIKFKLIDLVKVIELSQTDNLEIVASWLENYFSDDRFDVIAYGEDDKVLMRKLELASYAVARKIKEGFK